MSEIPACDRPREKIAAKGAAALRDEELVEAIIGRGTRGRDVRTIAREICGLIGTRKATLSYDDLAALDGVGPTKASQIVACFELGRRYCSGSMPQGKVTSPADVLPLLGDLGTRKQEHFVCITLNGAGEVLGNRVVTVGLLNHSLVHPREVFSDAITDRAASVICVHNHPSGSLEPSSQDIAITAQLKEAGALIGIPLIDHIIVSRNGHLSMRERGLV